MWLDKQLGVDMSVHIPTERLICIIIFLDYS